MSEPREAPKLPRADILRELMRLVDAAGHAAMDARSDFSEHTSRRMTEARTRVEEFARAALSTQPSASAVPKRDESPRDRERAALEKWAERVAPSGDVDEVQRTWERSLDYQEFWDSELARTPAAPAAQSFQQRMDAWLLACFGETIARDKAERNHRFLEEALELVQAAGCTASEAHQLVDYTFGRPVGETRQEVGGVVTTLAALCAAHEIDMDAAAEAELARIWTKVDVIRAKQAAKPKHSPLPERGVQRVVPDAQDWKLVTKIPLKLDYTLSLELREGDRSHWQLEQGGEYIRLLSEEESEFVDAALAAAPLVQQMIAPTEMSPEFTDTARAALLWVLWHHQGGSSPVGQPLRFALGMGQHDHLSEHQVAEAKRWKELTKSRSEDFHARAAPVSAASAEEAERRAFESTNETERTALLRHWWRKGYADGRLVPHRKQLTDEEAMRVVINACDSLNITRVHELGGKTRTICEEAGLLEIFRAVEHAHEIGKDDT